MSRLLSRLPGGVFVAIPVLWVAAAHVGPLLAMARISLLDAYPTAPGTAPSFGLQAYAAFLDGPGYRASLAHSLWLAGAATGIALAIGWPLAWHVAVRVPPARRLRRLALLVAPFWTSEVLRMFAVVLLLANRGALNAVLRWTGLTGAPVALLYGNGSVLLGMVYTVLLTMLLPLFAAFDRLPAEVLDAAADLGARAWRRQLFVTLPLAVGGITSGVALTFLLCIGVLVAPDLLGGAGTPAFATVIADCFAAASGRWPLGAAFSLVLLVLGTACAGALAWGVRAVAGAAPSAARLRA
jgi:spermidine/putrescine transport system permease protein